MSRLQDIANELDMSVSLVSKVLNGRMGTTGASAETVGAINDVARRMNYRKNTGAAALARGRQNAVGLFMHRVGVTGSGISEAIVRGASDRLVSHGMKLVLNFFEFTSQFEAFRPHLGPHAMDGVITAGIPHSELGSTLKELADAGLAVVTLHDRGVDPAFINIAVNQEEVGRLATVHLIEQGCRRIGHIQVDFHRAIGYLRAMADAGLGHDPRLVIPARDYSLESGRAAARQWLNANLDIDGVVAQSDNQAAGVIYEFLRAGKRVPHDIKVTGVDNSPLCDLCIHPITSIDCAQEAQGALAVDQLIKLLNKETLATSVIEPTLRVRASTVVS